MIRTTDSLRIGDAERDAAIAALSRHFTDGRLTQAEHEERAGLALKARTGADLRALFTDLPRLADPPPGRPRFGVTRVMQPLVVGAIAGLVLMAGFLVAIHLAPVIMLVGLMFVAVRLSVGQRRGWQARVDRGPWASGAGGRLGGPERRRRYDDYHGRWWREDS